MLAAVTVVVVAPVGALTLLPADFNEMVAGSQTIVRGRVVDVQPELIAGRTSIQSVITLEVIDTIKGTAVTSVAFRVPGGRIGRYRRVVVGAPEFTAGQEVVVFLSGRAPALPMPFGLSQGVYRVADGVVRADSTRHALAVGEFVKQLRVVAGAAP